MSLIKILLFTLLFLTGISFSWNTPLPGLKTDADRSIRTDTVDVKGKVLLEKNCYACHSPAMTAQQRIAPPIQMVRQHYLTDHDDKDDFVTAVINWVGKPNEAASKMPHAVTRFGIMPKMVFPEEEVKAIAEYLFEADLNMSGHGMNGRMGQNQGNRPEAFVYPQILQEGQEFVNKAQSALAGELIKAIKESGTSGAISFCNTNATQLTDSIAAELNVFIKRVTDRTRNELNQAEPVEMAYIIQSKNNIREGRTINPVVFINGDKWRGYYPIITNELCLQCHGSEDNDIDPVTLKEIKKNYPNDKATGYKISELRGLWVIDF
ncbi:DUF3365 domain-containing protein [Balneola sp. MJW-20]|uniref:c-type heme family protein n=1 Tax=Gracilimonas aurantiaca TaxID=3234185 RepID=UPI003467317B